MEKLSCEVDPETVWKDLMGRSGEIATLDYPRVILVNWEGYSLCSLSQLLDVDFVGRGVTLGAKVPGG